MSSFRMRLAGVAVFALLLAACHSGGQTTEQTATPEPTAAASAEPSAGASASPSTSAEPTETPTPQPNLLSYENGTIVRAYSPDISEDPDEISEHGTAEDKAAEGQFAVFELAGVADLTGVEVFTDGREGNDQYSVSVAGSTTSATSGFTDITTVKSATDTRETPLDVRATARWVKITLHGVKPHIRGVYAFGTLHARPANAPVPQVMVDTDRSLRYKDGSYNVGDASKKPWWDRVVVMGNGMAVTECDAERWGDSEAGPFDGRVMTWGKENRLVLNDEGTLLVGTAGGAQHFAASPSHPKFCDPIVEGSGPRKILVLERGSHEQQFGLQDDTLLPNTQFSSISAPMLTKELLDANSMVIFNMVCVPADTMAQSQLDAVNDYVKSGHIALIWDSDACGEKTDYAFLPYQFKTNNPGAAGAHGKRLIETESDALGSLDKSDAAHYFDAKAYADNEGNQLGDANTTVTKDDHWCGHLFGTNTNNVNGFMQMYAPYGQGFFVYDGFDHDDAGLPEHQRVRTLEMTLTVPADLPCNTKASQGFVLQPNRDGTFTAGKAQTLHFDMELLANEGWKGHVAMSTTGDFNATVAPQQFDVDGGTQALGIDVAVPASAKAGSYAITVVASDAAGTTKSQAVIQLNATAPLIKQIQTQKRIRLYGIHFDYDSAHIQPRSEPVIKQVADLMKQNPKLRFQVEGHTDSDGGADYNLKLSQRRAQAVVDDLVHRYHIAASRLVARGFGLTRPVAPNTTEGGKALNRRVELLVL